MKDETSYSDSQIQAGKTHAYKLKAQWKDGRKSGFSEEEFVSVPAKSMNK